MEESEETRELEAVAGPATLGGGVPGRVPNFLHFLLFLGLTVAGLVVGEGLALVLGSGPLSGRLANPRLQLGAEFLGYALALGAAWAIFQALWRRPFPGGAGVEPQRGSHVDAALRAGGGDRLAGG